MIQPRLARARHARTAPATPRTTMGKVTACHRAPRNENPTETIEPPKVGSDCTTLTTLPWLGESRDWAMFNAAKGNAAARGNAAAARQGGQRDADRANAAAARQRGKRSAARAKTRTMASKRIQVAMTRQNQARKYLRRIWRNRAPLELERGESISSRARSKAAVAAMTKKVKTGFTSGLAP